VIAAVSLGAPTVRCSLKKLKEYFGKMVVETAAKISVRMGFKNDIPGAPNNKSIKNE